MGNQVNFIPAINQLKKRHKVFTDSEFLNALGVCPLSNMHPDLVYVPLAANWKDLIKVRMQYPFAEIHGFKYRVRGRSYSFGYDFAVEKNMNVLEVHTIRRLVPNLEPFYLPGYDPVKGTIVIGYTEKKPYQGDRFYRHWEWLRGNLISMGYRPVYVGDGARARKFRTYAGLIAMIKCSEFFIGVDSGLMHLADIFNVPGFVFWGDTAEKNKPVNLKVIHGLDTYPTFELLENNLRPHRNDITETVY